PRPYDNAVKPIIRHGPLIQYLSRDPHSTAKFIMEARKTTKGLAAFRTIRGNDLFYLSRPADTTAAARETKNLSQFVDGDAQVGQAGEITGGDDFELAEQGFADGVGRHVESQKDHAFSFQSGAPRRRRQPIL